jgi:hypothetical protein
MKLLTEKIKKSLPPLGSTSDIPVEEKIITCKFFNPCGAGTWYVCEGSEQDGGDWIFFGLVDLFEVEWGYFSLSELEGVTVSLGLGIERDIHFENRRLSEEQIGQTF